MKKALVLVLNCGSSSIKSAVIDPHTGASYFSGLVQSVGTVAANIKYSKGAIVQAKDVPNIDYRTALQEIINLVRSFTDICAVGHRVVHGGEKFTQSVLITDEVLRAIREHVYLAPLHNPANVLGIEEASQAFSMLPQGAVFDTAFHQTVPDYAYIYPVPYELYQTNQVRRYGFHGTSHRFVSRQAAILLEKPLSETAFIIAHLGNGCSAAAVLHGKSVDTTMGLTPLEGLMMGTRSGDVDPSLHGYLADNLGYDIHRVTEMLNKNSGLLGVSGVSADMRMIEKQVVLGEKRAVLAFEIFCYRLAKYIAALAVSLGTIDALVFTGGIGENSQMVRAKTLQWLKLFAFELDAKRNAEHGENSKGIITTVGSTVAMVIPTNEEWLIAQDLMQLIQGKQEFI